MGDQVSLSSFQKDLGIPINLKMSQASSPLKPSTPRASRGFKRCEAPCPGEAGNYGFL